MGNEAPPRTQDNIIGTVEESRLFAYDASDNAFIPLHTNSDGELEVSAVSLQGSVGVEDASGTQVNPLDKQSVEPITGTSTAAGTSSAIVLDLGGLRSSVDFFYDVSASGTLEIEVSTDNTTWRPFQTIDTSASDTPLVDVVQFETAYRYVRIYAGSGDLSDATVNQLEASAKGIN